MSKATKCTIRFEYLFYTHWSLLTKKLPLFYSDNSVKLGKSTYSDYHQMISIGASYGKLTVLQFHKCTFCLWNYWWLQIHYVFIPSTLIECLDSEHFRPIRDVLMTDIGAINLRSWSCFLPMPWWKWLALDHYLLC